MNAELEKAFCGVYSSSKEIVRNNQHHLYCNMLDLLTSTCKATGGALVSNIPIDDQIDFWCCDILPLVFDDAVAVQSSALKALEQGVLRLDIAVVHRSTHWPTVRAAIINELRPRVHALRDQHNHNWHLVWCVLVHLLDRDILKNASTINSFLAIVELGFRSPAAETRIEAFACWRQLIALFAAHDEICNQKRLKLISIPLKSSQAKTAEAAVVKLRVWWYLLTCLGGRLAEFFEPVVEHFLLFCFGSRQRGVKGAAHQYAEVRALALPCWTSLLTAAANSPLERALLELGLEPLTQPSPLVDFAAMGRHRQSLVDATLAAVGLVVHSDHTPSSESEQYTLELLMRYLMKPLLCPDDPALSMQICRELAQFVPSHPRPVVFAINCIAADGIQWSTPSGGGGGAAEARLDDYADVLEALMQLLIAGKAAAVPRAILERCIGQVVSLRALGGGRSQWRALAIVLDLLSEGLLSTADSNMYQLRLLVWQQVSGALLAYLAENSLDCRLKEHATVLQRWTMWPLGFYAAHVRAATGSSFDAAFLPLWQRLLHAGQNAPERRQFLVVEMQQQLERLLPLGPDDVYFEALLHAYATELLKVDHGKDVAPYRQLLALVKRVMVAEAPAKLPEACLNVVRLVLAALRDDELLALMDSVKAVVAHVLQFNQKHAFTKAVFAEWKQAVQERLRAHANRSISGQAAELFKNSDVFVVIPSVWRLDPDKLTDHQKERFRKKTSDIPALYNDMSQSQESSSIKPWTPNKIVVAKDDHAHDQAAVVDSDVEAADVPKPRPSQELNATPTTAESKKGNKEERKRPLRHSLRSQRKLIPETATPPPKPPVLDNPVKENQPVNVEPSSIVEYGGEKKSETLPAEDLNLNTSSSLGIAPMAIDNDAIAKADEVAKRDENCVNVANVKETPETFGATKANGDHASPVSPVEEAVVALKPAEIQQQNQMDLGVNATKEAAKLDRDPSAISQSNVYDFVEQKIMSPKRNLTKYTPLSSPPDRKLINNSTSPTLRPKPTAHLMGRGAQLINMIRNKKVDLTNTSSTNSTGNGTGTSAGAGISYGNATQSTGGGGGGGKTSHSSLYAKVERSMDVVSVTAATTDAATVSDVPMEPPEHHSTPMQCGGGRELLVFSRTLPSSRASPSTSILKRKVRSDSLDDLTAESPMNKRKRVSFHDPPVSLTKEYLRDVDEGKTKLKRCLNMDKAGAEAKHALKRQHKMHSISLIDNYTAALEKTERMDNAASEQLHAAAKDDWMECGKLTDAVALAPTPAPTTAVAPAPVPIPTPLDLSLVEPETLLDYMVGNFTMETMLDKYCAAATESAAQWKMANSLAKHISNCMAANAKVKTNVLEVLSENHSKDFLDHAVQENLSSVVCDRLNLNSVIDYICAKSKINANCRGNLLAQLPGIFKQCKAQKERMDCMKQLLQSIDLTDDDTLDLMTVLVQKRTNAATTATTSSSSASATNCSIDVCASESAVDSSSNL